MSRALGALAALALAPVALTRAASIGRVHPVSSREFAPAQAALVLGARVWEDGRPSLFLRQRVEVGVELYRRGLVPRLLMSGAGANREGLDETAAMVRVAQEMGVPRTAIDVDPEGINTWASAQRAAAEYGLATAIVATQEFHLPRALWLCRSAGIDAQGAYPPILAREHTAVGYVREVPASVKAMADTWRARRPSA